VAHARRVWDQGRAPNTLVEMRLHSAMKKPIVYTKASITSRDGTAIGYRQLGSGPGLIAIHGGMQASGNLMRLAAGLADAFTVYLPDRRGRGRSGPGGDGHGIAEECEDVEALQHETGAHNVFGLSIGGVIALHSAARVPLIQRVAAYEPPLAPRPGGWAARYQQEAGVGRLAEALVTVSRGIGDTSLLSILPRLVSVPIMRLGMREDAKRASDDYVPLSVLVTAFRHDLSVVTDAAAAPDRLRGLETRVLLIGGSRSPRPLKEALSVFRGILPGSEYLELTGLSHLAADNGGKPDRVAAALRHFFGD
jgi:pimeloyl-ACP methyl ester carboxylesterase